MNVTFRLPSEGAWSTSLSPRRKQFGMIGLAGHSSVGGIPCFALQAVRSRGLRNTCIVHERLCKEEWLKGICCSDPGWNLHVNGRTLLEKWAIVLFFPLTNGSIHWLLLTCVPVFNRDRFHGQ